MALLGLRLDPELSGRQDREREDAEAGKEQCRGVRCQREGRLALCGHVPLKAAATAPTVLACPGGDRAANSPTNKRAEWPCAPWRSPAPRPPGCLGCHLLARPSLSTPGHRRELFRTADEWGCWAQARGAGSTDPEAAEPWTSLGREDEAREAGPSWGTPAAEAWPARRGGGASLLQLRGTRRPPRRPRASPQEQSLHELPPHPARPAARGLRPPAVGAGEGQGGRPQAPRVRAVHRPPCSPPPRTRELGVCSRLHPAALPGPLPSACHDAGSRSRTRPALQLDGLPARAAWALSTAPGGGGHALLTADAQQ